METEQRVKKEWSLKLFSIGNFWGKISCELWTATVFISHFTVKKFKLFILKPNIMSNRYALFGRII